MAYPTPLAFPPCVVVHRALDIDQRREPPRLLRRYPSIRSSDRERMTGIDTSILMVGKTNTRREFDWAKAHQL